jgi:hypothetical protein
MRAIPFSFFAFDPFLCLLVKMGQNCGQLRQMANLGVGEVQSWPGPIPIGYYSLTNKKEEEKSFSVPFHDCRRLANGKMIRPWGRRLRKGKRGR